MKSGQRATRADAGGQRLPDASKDKSPSKAAVAPAGQSNANAGMQDKAAKKK